MICNSKRLILTEFFDRAIRSVEPNLFFKTYVPKPPRGRTILIGAGKGVIDLASAFSNYYKESFSNALVTQYKQKRSKKDLDIVWAGHPLPDQNGLDGANKIFRLTANLTSNDLVIALFTGGGSALLPCPPEGFTLDDEILLNHLLLRSGLPISGINLIRKHFSKIKGGRLAAHIYPAKLKTFLISDVPNDDPSQIASGPTIADSGTRQDALNLIKKFKIEIPTKIMKYLRSADANAPTPSDPIFFSNESTIVASASKMLKVVAAYARTMNFEVEVLSADVQGEAAKIARQHAEYVIKLLGRIRHNPILLLSGGETTVKLDGTSGRGGRNTEYLLSLAVELADRCDFIAIAADTDGIDGSEMNAGAFADQGTVSRIKNLGLNPIALLNNHDAYSAFEADDNLFFTGPTGTNLNDFRAILINGY